MRPGTVASSARLRSRRSTPVIGADPGRVLREAQAAARLNHPGIVTLYEMGEEDGSALLVTELVEGSTLDQLSREGALSDREVGEIGADLCEALDHAHSRAVIHRDIKPQNVLVTEEGEPRAKLMDFGVARLTDATALTAPGGVVGTLAYMAPEQAEGRSEVGPEADVYSLALTLYECWAGENPNRRATPAATARAIGARARPLRRHSPRPSARAERHGRWLPGTLGPRTGPPSRSSARRSRMPWSACRTALPGQAPTARRTAPRARPPPPCSVSGSPPVTGSLCRRISAGSPGPGKRPICAAEGANPISVLRNLESRIEGLVEGVFSRAFSSEVQPVELARKLAKEMDAHKTAGVARVYVPNEYTVYLSKQDRGKLEGYERSLEQELSGYLLDHARRRGYDLLTRPAVEFKTDERLRLGEFGIQTRLVKPPAHEGDRPSQGEEGHTQVYSAVREPEASGAKSPQQRAEALVATRAVVSLEDRRYVLEGPRATIGRSKEAECVLRDPNVSRRHAELRRAASGDWTIVDLGSTNGVKVNGRRVASSRLSPGDQVTIGSTTFSFDIEQ